MRISDWSSDVCSSDLQSPWAILRALPCVPARRSTSLQWHHRPRRTGSENVSSSQSLSTPPPKGQREDFRSGGRSLIIPCASRKLFNAFGDMAFLDHQRRSEEHTSELQSLMRNSYAVFCLKKKKKMHLQNHITK